MRLVNRNHRLKNISFHGKHELHRTFRLHLQSCIDESLTEIESNDGVVLGCQFKRRTTHGAANVQDPAICFERGQRCQQFSHTLREAKRVCRSVGVWKNRRNSFSFTGLVGKMEPQVLVHKVVCLVESCASTERVVSVFLRKVSGGGCVGRTDHTEARMLQEVRAKVETTKSTSHKPCAGKRTTHDHIVLSIKTRSGEVVVVGVEFKSFEWVEVVLSPFPCVSHGIKMASFAWFQHIDRGCGPKSEVQVGVCAVIWLSKFMSTVRHDAIRQGVLSDVFQRPSFRADEVVFRLCDDTISLRLAMEAIIL
mmetsp:Transcript_10855/g.15654  ORF Transcript_10855/g.15654 Transcript_10855/m.15654 type:complete len:308 (-) Transcript_10855:367-1290(-)